jgi:hypothetical protein
MIKRVSVLTFLLLVFSLDIFARAGGGSGGGSAGGNYVNGLSVLIAWILSLILALIVRKRMKQSKKQIIESEKIDAIWNYDQLYVFTEIIFMKMQDAWMKKDLDSVKDLMTENCRQDLEKKMHRYFVCNEINMLEEIKIKSIKIVGSEDYVDNEKDSFIVYISGSMVDYVISVRTHNINDNSAKDSARFSDLYYFRRHIDTWLLDKIENKVTISKVYHAKHIIEKAALNNDKGAPVVDKIKVGNVVEDKTEIR